MTPEQALYEIKLIVDNCEDASDIWAYTKQIIDEFYGDLPEIKFFFYDEDEWIESDGYYAPKNSIAPIIFLYTDEGSTYELGLDPLIGGILPDGYAMCMEASIEGPYFNKSDTEAVRQCVIDDLGQLGFIYKERN